MKETFIIKEFDIDHKKPDDCIYISYSQFSTFANCPLRWKLKYIDKIKEDKPSIHAVFGTSMHNVIQHWLQVMYNETVKKSNELDFKELLLGELKKNYAADVEKYDTKFSNKEELTEFFMDGYSTLEYLRKKRTVYFDRKNEQLVGTEVKILIQVDPKKPNVYLIGYLDVVIKDKFNNTFKILDLKTSTRGWKKWDKDDKVKMSQLLLYKIYFSRLYNIPIDTINVEYIVLKRKLDEDSLWPQRRVQVVSPSQGSVSYNKVQRDFQKFIDTAFDDFGKYNTLSEYPAIAGSYSKNCRFCEFRDRYDLCPVQQRKIL